MGSFPPPTETGAWETGSSKRMTILVSSPEKRCIHPCSLKPGRRWLSASFSCVLARVSWSPSSVIVCELTWDTPSILVSLFLMEDLGTMAGSVSCHRVNIRGVTPCVICTFFLRKPVKWHTPAFKPHFYKHTYVRLLLAFLHEYCFLFFNFFLQRWEVLRFSIFFWLFFVFNYTRVLDLKLWKQSQYLQRMSPISSQLLTSPLHSLLSAQVLFKEVNNMEKHGLRRQQNPIRT